MSTRHKVDTRPPGPNPIAKGLRRLGDGYARLAAAAGFEDTNALFASDLCAGIDPASLEGRYAYFPWLPGHTDALVGLIDPRRERVIALPLFRGTDRQAMRKRHNQLARRKPDVSFGLCIRALSPLRDHLAGVIFTLDWSPAMRQAAYACRALSIPTLLIPHESVFAKREAYYRDSQTGADYPICDRILCWGELQRGIFEERGVEPERLAVVGSPKLDEAIGYQPQMSRSAFCSRYGLSPDRPIVLFAMQPLDAQLDEDAARAAQQAAIADVLAYCEAHNVQVLVRLPPSSHKVLSQRRLRWLARRPSVAVDDSSAYRTSPLESLSHAAVVCAINSTMLFEGALMGRPAIACHYVRCSDTWVRAGIPRVTHTDELHAALARALTEQATTTEPEGQAWAAKAFSVGTFDRGSVGRIHRELDRVAQDPPHHAAYAHLFEDRAKTSAHGTASLHRTPSAAMGHLEAMLGFRSYLHAPPLRQAANSDVFVKWGIVDTEAKRAQDHLARRLGRPQLIVEDGFLRSKQLGLSGEPGLSIIVDTETAYYDATRPSRLERRLNSDHEPSPAQGERARACMTSIRKGRLSKYNHAPDTGKAYGGAPRVLLVDQRAGDASVAGALADEDSFQRMLDWALAERPGHAVLVKRHPDATLAGKGCYFHDERLAPYRDHPRLLRVDEEVNPHTLFDQVDEVCVVSSGMGMEALIAGVPVRCFAAPFYAGWGLTEDMVQVPRRQRTRPLVDLFHFAYIEHARYYAPQLGHVGELEDVIAFLGGLE